MRKVGFLCLPITDHESIRIAYANASGLFATDRRVAKMTPKIDDEMARKKAGDEAFGRRLASIRKLRGLTQTDLAAAASTTQRAVSYYENGFGFPPAPQLVALAKALHVTTDELLGVKSVKPDARAEDPETRRLWRKFQQVAALPEKDQRAVIRLINSLAGARE